MAANTVRETGDPRFPHVHLTHEVQVGDVVAMKELPFVVGVLADLSGKPEESLPGLCDRKFVGIDHDNFNGVMRGIGPRLAFNVDNNLSSHGGAMAIELRFNSLDDFRPERVASQIASLRNFLRERGDKKTRGQGTASEVETTETDSLLIHQPGSTDKHHVNWRAPRRLIANCQTV